jgi:hypothetical protein
MPRRHSPRFAAARFAAARFAAARSAAAPAVAALAAALAITGCGSAHGTGGGASASPGAAARSSAPPAPPATPTVNPGGPISPAAAVTAPGTAAAGARPVQVVISGLPGKPTLTPGGPALTFTVTLHNVSGSAYRDITPVVSMGHCACTGGPIAMAPQGTLQERDPVTGSWHAVRYDPEGGGTDFLLVVQQPGISLPAGGSASFLFRVAFTRRQQRPLQAGTTAIDVSVVRLPAHTPAGQVPAGSVPVTVKP